MAINKNTLTGGMSIIIGGMIYVFWRENSLLMFSWFNDIGIKDVIEVVRYSVSPFRSIVPKWVCFSLPNAMWLFGGMLLFAGIWKDNVCERYFWMFLFSIIAVASELGQLAGFVSGVYDLTDMLLMFFAILLAALFDAKQQFKEHKNAKA